MLKIICEKLAYFYRCFNSMIWHILRYWISFLLPAFYKSIQAKNAIHLKVKGPVIIAMNHPNAFTDPVAFTMACYPPRLKYLARGDVFKPGFVSWMLESIGIVPIFRIQDGGKEGLKKNEDAYQRVNKLLKKNAKIIVFAEGLCVQERRLRPLKKGISRMVFGAYEALKNDELIVVPVGVNYDKPDKFRSNLFYNVGEPIYVKDFMGEYKENPARANNLFLQTLEPKMKELITHINEEKNDEVVYQLEILLKRDWVKEQDLNYKNLDESFTVLRQITELVNKTAEINQEALDEFKSKATLYFNSLKENKLRDWLINPKQNANVNWPMVFIRSLLLFFGAPIYIFGFTGNFLPAFLTDYFTRKIVKKPEFYSSIALAIGMVVFLLVYCLWFSISYWLFAFISYPIVICSFFMLCGWFCLYYHPFLLKTLGMSRVLKNKVLAQDLLKQREILLSLINKF